MCKKKVFLDRISAMLTLAEIKARGKGNRLERRFYQCNECNSWHLTSRQKEEAAASAYFNN